MAKLTILDLLTRASEGEKVTRAQMRRLASDAQDLMDVMQTLSSSAETYAEADRSELADQRDDLATDASEALSELRAWFNPADLEEFEKEDDDDKE